MDTLFFGTFNGKLVKLISVNATPRLYHWFIRPKWLTKKYIHNHILSHFPLERQTVLDFGAGTGANCTIVDPSCYLGIDPDAERISYAKRLYPRHRFEVFDGKTIPADNQTVDYILIVAVLHHLSAELIAAYMKEFARILKQSGSIIVIEPCLCKDKPLCNWFMNWYDKGEYIREEGAYLRFFEDHRFQCRVLKRFRKCLLYHELFFSARLHH